MSLTIFHVSCEMNDLWVRKSDHIYPVVSSIRISQCQLPPRLEILWMLTSRNILSPVFIYDTDWTRYDKLVEDLENNFTQGQDNYPKTLTTAFNLFLYWKNSEVNPQESLLERGGDGVAFETTNEKK